MFARLDADSAERPTGDSPTRPTRFKARAASSFWGGQCQQQEPTPSGSLPLLSGETFLLKGLQSTRLNALDPNRMKVLWERPISKGSRLLAADDKTVYLGGAEISAIDMQSRKLLWATRVPGGCANARVLVRKDAIWQSTPRGIIELDPRTGEVRRFFRGKDLGSVGWRPGAYRTAPACRFQSHDHRLSAARRLLGTFQPATRPLRPTPHEFHEHHEGHE